MSSKHTLTIAKTGSFAFTALALLLAGCSGGGGSSSSGGGTVTGVATPSKVSVVNTN